MRTKVRKSVKYGQVLNMAVEYVNNNIIFAILFKII